jgi:hypothetical protein
MTGRDMGRGGVTPAFLPAANDDGAAAGLYVISNDVSGPSKIGLSNNPERRLAQLSTGSAVPLRIWHVEAVPAADALRLEQAAHRQLSRYRLSGEWFGVSVDVAVSEITLALIHHADNPAPRGSAGARRKRA